MLYDVFFLQLLTYVPSTQKPCIGDAWPSNRQNDMKMHTGMQEN